jgi:hypothetical protein
LPWNSAPNVERGDLAFQARDLLLRRRGRVGRERERAGRRGESEDDEPPSSQILLRATGEWWQMKCAADVRAAGVTLPLWAAE